MFKIRTNNQEAVRIKAHNKNIGLAIDNYGNVYSTYSPAGASNKKVVESLRKTRY